LRQQQELFYEIVSQRASEWLARWDDILMGRLSSEEILDLRNTVLVDELMETGFLLGGEPTQHGLKIEGFIDWLGRQLP